MTHHLRANRAFCQGTYARAKRASASLRRSGTPARPLSAVYRIATFYNAFSLEPRGKYVVTICTGTACHVKGAADILAAFEEQLGIKSGQTTDDMRFTLDAVRCIGCCGLAPVLTINEDVHGLMTTKKVPELVDMYRGN